MYYKYEEVKCLHCTCNFPSYTYEEAFKWNCLPDGCAMYNVRYEMLYLSDRCSVFA